MNQPDATSIDAEVQAETPSLLEPQEGESYRVRQRREALRLESGWRPTIDEHGLQHDHAGALYETKNGTVRRLTDKQTVREKRKARQRSFRELQSLRPTTEEKP